MANKTSAANVKIKGVAPGNDIENYDPRLQNQQRPARPTTPTTSSGGSWLGGLGQAVRAVGDRVNSAVAAAPTTPAAPTGSSSAYAAQAVQDTTSFLPDYSFAGSDSELGTTVSGIVGSGIVALAAVGICLAGGFFRKKKTV